MSKKIIDEMIQELLSETQKPPTFADEQQTQMRYDRLNTFLKAMEKY